MDIFSSTLDVVVQTIAYILQYSILDRTDYLIDTISDSSRDSEAEAVPDSLERDSIIPRIFVLANKLDSSFVDPIANHFHQVQLTKVLSRIADIEDLAGDRLARSRQYY